MESMPRLPYNELLTQWLWSQSMRAPSWAAAPMLEAYARADLREQLDRLTSPTLILHGQHDVFCEPAAARYLAERIGAELVEFAESGHSPHWEEPEKFRAAFETFLAAP